MASTEGEWQSRVQWSTLLVPITTRVSFWMTKPSSLVALAEASAPKWPRLRASPSAAASSASSQLASCQRPSRLISGVVMRSRRVDEAGGEAALHAERAAARAVGGHVVGHDREPPVAAHPEA